MSAESESGHGLDFRVTAGTEPSVSEAIVIAPDEATARRLHEEYGKVRTEQLERLREQGKQVVYMAEPRPVAFVAATDPHKLPDVARHLRERYPDPVFVLVGDDTLEKTRKDISAALFGPEQWQGRIGEHLEHCILHGELLQAKNGRDWEVTPRAAEKVDLVSGQRTRIAPPEARQQHSAEVLIEKGRAPYKFETGNAESPFLRTLDPADNGKERIYWGSDLPRAAANVQIGDVITATRVESKPVTLTHQESKRMGRKRRLKQRLSETNGKSPSTVTIPSRSWPPTTPGLTARTPGVNWRSSIPAWSKPETRLSPRKKGRSFSESSRRNN